MLDQQFFQDDAGRLLGSGKKRVGLLEIASEELALGPWLVALDGQGILVLGSAANENQSGSINLIRVCCS